MLLFVLLAAPFLYFVVGMAVLSFGSVGRDRYSLLVGGAVAGLAAELAYAMRWSVPSSLGALLALCGFRCVQVMGVHCYIRHIRLVGVVYAVSLLPACVSPFPVLGTWDGDWFVLYESGKSLFNGVPLTGMALERPPLFGAAAGLLWLFDNSFASYQLFCSVMSAGLLLVVIDATERFWPLIDLRLVVIPVVMSVLFLHNTAACWGKLMAAGLVLASVIDLYFAVPDRRWEWAPWLFAMAVAVHQSSIIYLPLLVCTYVSRAESSQEFLFWLVVVFGIAGFLIVGLFEAWTVVEYGWTAKINANPAVAQRDPSIGFLRNTTMVIATSFVGWSPISSINRWLSEVDRFGIKNMMAELFWLVTSCIQVLAGTLIGCLLPSLVAGRLKLLRSALRVTLSRRGRGYLAGVLAAILLNGALNPFASASGTMQTGLVPVGVASVWLSSVWFARRGDGTQALVRWSFFIGFAPWFALMLFICAGIASSETVRRLMDTGSEGDWKRIVEHSLTPLGASNFPYLQLSVVVALCAIAHGFSKEWLESSRHA